MATAMHTHAHKHVHALTLTLPGATTENPSYALNKAILSRCRVVRAAWRWSGLRMRRGARARTRAARPRAPWAILSPLVSQPYSVHGLVAQKRRAGVLFNS